MPIKKFFNTSGVAYREKKLKDKVKVLSDEELIDILSTDGMLVKRPLVVHENGVMTGFKAEKWSEELLECENCTGQEADKKIEGDKMDMKDMVLKILRESEGAMKAGEIAESAGVDKKEIDKAIKALKKDEKIMSPKRCYYDITE